MFGAIAGDIVGSVYEFDNLRTMRFPLFGRRSHFTDDTVLTVAVAETILTRGEYSVKFREYFQRYPDRSYGASFRQWASSSSLEPYGSFGNGSAMRVSPVGFAFDSLEGTLAEAKRSALATHNHPEGVKGAQAIAAAIFLARTGASKEEIREYIRDVFHYHLDNTLGNMRKTYTFNETCQGTVPESLIVFLRSRDYEDAIRKAISIGGDSDTIACIVGGIAEAYYGGVPAHILSQVTKRLDPALLQVIDEFRREYVSAR